MLGPVISDPAVLCAGKARRIDAEPPLAGACSSQRVLVWPSGAGTGEPCGSPAGTGILGCPRKQHGEESCGINSNFLQRSGDVARLAVAWAFPGTEVSRCTWPSSLGNGLEAGRWTGRGARTGLSWPEPKSGCQVGCGGSSLCACLSAQEPRRHCEAPGVELGELEYSQGPPCHIYSAFREEQCWE